MNDRRFVDRTNGDEQRVITGSGLSTYRIPVYRFLQAGWYAARGEPRSLGDDFRYLIRNLPAAPILTGVVNLPASGSFVLVANHYERPGLWMGWSGMIVARAVHEHTRRRLRWIAIAEWRDFRLVGIPIPPPITRFIFGRFFRTFGFIAMEPEGSSAHERAEGVRAALQAIKQGEVVGIFPEGDIGATPAMIRAQAGSGAFLAALAGRGAPLIPTGLHESEGRLHVVFGPPVDITDVKNVDRSQRDEAASRRVMDAVAALLPSELRGYYVTGSEQA